MSEAQARDAVTTARDYYDSEDADRFYATIWGGEDIHVGLYEAPDDSIFEASRRTVAIMASLLDGRETPMTRALDIGSGYCGAARYLAQTYGWSIDALNLSPVENARARELNARAGLADRIVVTEGSFEEIPFDDAKFDVVWSQDAILHSANRGQVLREVARVLRPGGQFVFTDPMQADECPPGVLQPILERIHLQNLGSPSRYLQLAHQAGLDDPGFMDMSAQLVRHYSRVLEETERRTDELAREVSENYIERMKKGLRHWIDGGERGHLAWGIFRFRKLRD